MLPWNARVTMVAVLLAATIFLQTRARKPFAPARTSLEAFPTQLGELVGVDLPILRDDLETLGPGEFLQRRYADGRIERPGVDLYLAYLPGEHALYKHALQDCLTGSGWSMVESGTTTLKFEGEGPFQARRYLIARGTDRQLVVFWYWTHGRRVTTVDPLNLFIMFDSLRLNRKDSAMIRLSTPLQPDEAPHQAEQRLLAFGRVVNPLLDEYIPR